MLFVSTSIYDQEEVLQTYYDITTTLEKFLRHQESSPVTRKTVTFGTILKSFYLKSALEGYET